MEDQIELRLNDAGHGAFVIEKEGERLAEMAIVIRNGDLEFIFES
jgi:hypothetical protein